jgi:PAS domain S-box-containing protein
LRFVEARRLGCIHLTLKAEVVRVDQYAELIARYFNQTFFTSVSQGSLGAQPGIACVRGIRGYALGVIAVVSALILRTAFDPIWGDRLAYAWFFLAVIVVARFASKGPQFFAIVAGGLVANWFFIQPRGSLQIASPLDEVNTLIYCTVSGLVVLGSLRARRMFGRELAARDRITGILECTSDAVCTLDADWSVTYFNKRASDLAGMPAGEVLGRELWSLWPDVVGTRFETEYGRVMAERATVHFEELSPKKRWIEVNACPYGEGMAIFFRDITERKERQSERERLIAELQVALADVKTLSGLLPICANCKNVRDDRGYWKQIETFIGERSNAKFSHGICPTCFVQLYPDLEMRNGG